MLKNKFTIFGVMGILMLGIFSFNVVNAGTSSLYVSPATLDKNVGDTFMVAVSIAPNGPKVCAVEGKLLLDKLSCQNIVLGEGMMAQKSPSCADLSFLLGIPGCVTENKTLFTMTVQGENEGLAILDIVGIDVVGEGVPLPFTLVKGSYTLSIKAVTPQTPIVPVTPVTPQIIDDIDTGNVIEQAPVCVCEDWEDWQWDLNKDCGQGGCDSRQLLQTRERECNPESCEIEVENRCVADAYCASAIPIEDSTQTATILDTLGSIGYGWLIGGLILLIFLIVIPYFLKRKNRR